MGIADFFLGKNETKTNIPDWLKDLGEFGAGRAQQVANLGFAPWQGPDVAAFSPMQDAAMAGTNSAAAAYGLPTSQGTGMPEAQTFAGGVKGYSSYPMLQEQMAAMAQSQPDLFRALSQMFPNMNLSGMAGGATPGAGGGGQPGAAPVAPVAPSNGAVPKPNQGPIAAGGLRPSNDGNWSGARDVLSSGSGVTRPRARPDYDITQPRPQFNGLLDRIDGGGPGAGLAATMGGIPRGLLGLLTGRNV